MKFLPLWKKLHIQGQRRIAAVVKIALVSVNDKSQRVTAIAAIWQTTAVLRRRALYPEIAEIPTTPGIHRMGVVNSFFEKPFMNFPTANYCGTCRLSNGDAICNVVGMTVRLQNIICPDIGYVNIFRQFIWRNKRIKQNLFTLHLD